MNLLAQSCCVALCVLASSAFAAPADFTTTIAPLFDEHCSDCHGATDPDGELSLDTFDSLIKGGKTGKAIEAGKAQESLLVKFLEGRSGKTGKNQFMPPGKKPHLKPEEIALVRQWIDAGAPGPVGGAKPVDVLSRLPKIASATATKPVHSMAVSADGKIIALGKFGAVELIDAITRTPLRTIGGIAGNANALAFSNDGASLYAAAGDAGISGIAYQFNVADGKLIRKFAGHTDAVYAMALSPDGKLLATGGYDQKIGLWDAATGAATKLLKGHNGCINGLSFRPDGKVLASASADRTIKLWDPTTGARLDTLSQPTKEQFAVAFSADGKTLVAGGTDSRIRIWSVSAKAAEGSNPILDTRFAHEGAVLRLVFSPDGKSLLSSASDRTVKIWNAADVTERKTLEKQSDWAPAVAWLAADRVITARHDGTAALYELAANKSEPLLKANVAPAKSAAAAKPKATAKARMAAAKAELVRLSPRGFQSGATTQITATGKNLTGITAASAGNPLIKIVIIKTDAAGTTVTLAVTAPKELPRGAYDVSLTTAAGETAKVKLYADYLPQHISVGVPTSGGQSSALMQPMPVNVWGTLSNIGQQDNFRFHAKAGEVVTLDLAAKRVESKMATPRLEVFSSDGKRLAANSGLDSNSDPFLAFKPPASGDYSVRVSETTLDGSADHVYRLTMGALPYVVGWWPLSAPANAETKVNLVGYSLARETTTIKTGADGAVTLPLDTDDYRSRVTMKVLASTLPESIEKEPNDDAAHAQTLRVPASVNGLLHVPGDAEAVDADVYAFDAKKDETLVIETQAAMLGSPADTKLEVLDDKGDQVPRVLLQAVRDSWINFRSIDANNPDARVENWREMDLNQFIYFQGDVARIFRLPRGPDSGFLFFGFDGKRRAYFDTTATGHALDEPCYVVEPKPVGSELVANGLPVFTLNYANDDASDRKTGSDSRVFFTAPRTGKFLVRVTDARGWSGARFAYRLTLRQPEPDFEVKLAGENPSIGPGAAAGFSVKANRKDGFDGAIEVNITGLPRGFYASSPLVIDPGHEVANGSLFAAPDAAKDADWSKVKVLGCAMIGDKRVCKPANGFGKVTLGEAAKFAAFLEPDVGGRPAGHAAKNGKDSKDKKDAMEPMVMTISPGETKPVWIRVERNGNDGLINFDVHNLPHGIIVDNIGLNGVQVREKENEREIFIMCSKWVQEQDRLCHAAVISARNEQDSAGVQTSFPLLIKVRKPDVVTVR